MLSKNDLFTTLRELMAVAIDARDVLKMAADNPAHEDENRHIYAVHANALSEVLSAASETIASYKAAGLARAQALEPGDVVWVSSEIYQGDAIFEAVENGGLARVRVEAIGTVLLVDVDNIGVSPEC